MLKVFYLGNKARDYYDFDPNSFIDDSEIGYFEVTKLFKTFVRGNIELQLEYKKQKWYKDYIKGVKGYFYVEEHPIVDTLRIDFKTNSCELYFTNPEKIKSDNPFKIFIAMPFDDKLQDTFDAIIDVGKTLRETLPDIEIFRLDMHEGEAVDLIKEIYKNIAESGIIITDLTDGNANVYYELGIADALNKKVIQICKESKDLKFDVAHKKSIIFPNLKVLKQRLERDIRAIYNSSSI